MQLLPSLTVKGLASYMGLALGIVLASAILTTPMNDIETNLRRA
jgi:hypothetical protein